MVLLLSCQQPTFGSLDAVKYDVWAALVPQLDFPALLRIFSEDIKSQMRCSGIRRWQLRDAIARIHPHPSQVLNINIATAIEELHHRGYQLLGHPDEDVAMGAEALHRQLPQQRYVVGSSIAAFGT